jgi:hypothetical protein
LLLNRFRKSRPPLHPLLSANSTAKRLRAPVFGQEEAAFDQSSTTTISC